MDAEKSTVTVVGDVDVVLVVKALRKAKRPVAVVSVGEPDKEKKEEADKPEESKPLPACCSTCNSVVVCSVSDIYLHCFMFNNIAYLYRRRRI
ncbi:unnamed protein product [Musa textilis]